MKRPITALLLIAAFIFLSVAIDAKAEPLGYPPAQTCVVDEADYITCVLPQSQLPFLQLSYDCRVTEINDVDYSITVVCRTGEVRTGKWVKGETPVVHLPPLKKDKPKHKKKRKKKR